MLVASRAIVARSMDLNRTCCLCQHYLPHAIASQYTQVFIFFLFFFFYIFIFFLKIHLPFLIYVYVKETGCNVEIKVFFQIGDRFVRVCCLNVSGMAFWGGACRWD